MEAPVRWLLANRCPYRDIASSCVDRPEVAAPATCDLGPCTSLMSRPALALLAITCLFTGVTGLSWLQQPPSNQELLANYSKAADYATAAASVHGLPWWTPNYVQGCSLAFLSLGALTNLVLFASALVAEPYTAPKLAALAFLFLCPITMFAFIRRLCPSSGWTAFCCGAAYLFAPAILLRLGHVEHVANVLAFAMIPVAFHGVLFFLEQRSAWSAILCAAANSLLVLAYAKIAVLVLPLLGAFAFWVWMARAHFNLPPVRNVFLCLAAFVILAGLPNLPSLRESRFIAKFDFGPFPGWQKTYSAQSVLSWMDRESLLSGARTSPQSEVRTNSSYLGIAGLACVTGFFFLRKRAAWQTSEATVFRLFIALTFLAHWLGLGVNTALSGHLAFLSHSDSAWDPAIAISWALLVLQGVAIWMIMPGSLPARPWLSALALLVYFCVPGFRLAEKLPLYGGIRAPHDFFEMGGVFCFSVAAGVAASILIGQMPRRGSQLATAGALLGLASMDSASVVRSFFKGPMDQQTFDDFLSVQSFLKTTGSPGRIAPYSGRYFYLLTPLLSGRGLVTEAFGGQFMSRGVAKLNQASFSSREYLGTFLDIAGVSHLLIDKKDPDTPAELQEALKSLRSLVFENEHFVLLENPENYYPAAFAKNFIALDEHTADVAGSSLRAAGQGLLAISPARNFSSEEGLLALDKNPALEQHIERVPANTVHRKSFQEILVEPPAEAGWLVIPEAFHPDWRATQAGRNLQIARAYGAFLAVRLDGKSGTARLSFQPPWWYFASVWTSLAGWIGTVVLLGAKKLSLLPEGLQTFLSRTPPSGENLVPGAASVMQRSPVGSVLVIIPTYNEASGIGNILDKTLTAEPSLEILVIDDNSPDQTAKTVQSHPAFHRRVHLIKRDGKLGLGSAYKEGFRWAVARRFDTCIQIDADLSHDPADIPRLIEALENGADAAIGSRYSGGVRVMNWPQDRLLLSLGASRLVRTVTGLPLTDITSGFKAIRCSALQRLDWDHFITEGYGFQVELHFFLWKSGARLVEVPILFTERRAGQTKMTLGIAAEAAWRVVTLAIFKR
jgi:dolichol-phosphate mannosyltransferase